MLSGTAPVLVTVTTAGALVVPTGCGGNETDEGLTAIDCAWARATHQQARRIAAVRIVRAIGIGRRGVTSLDSGPRECAGIAPRQGPAPGPADSPGGELVGAKGFEPSTPCTPCRCATRLRYAPTETEIIAGDWVPALRRDDKLALEHLQD